MSKRQEILAAVDDQLNTVEALLLVQHKEVREFALSEHKAKDVVNVQKKVSETEGQLTDLLVLLLQNRDVSVEFRGESRALCDRARELNQYSRDMFKILADDLAERQKAEAKTKKGLFEDLISIFGVPGSFAGLVKLGVGEGRITVSEAAGAGAVVGGAYVFRDKIGKSIKATISGVANSPELLRSAAHSMLIDARVAAALAHEDSLQLAKRARNLVKFSRKPEGPIG